MRSHYLIGFQCSSFPNPPRRSNREEAFARERERGRTKRKSATSQTRGKIGGGRKLAADLSLGEGRKRIVATAASEFRTKFSKRKEFRTKRLKFWHVHRVETSLRVRLNVADGQWNCKIVSSYGRSMVTRRSTIPVSVTCALQQLGECVRHGNFTRVGSTRLGGEW